MPRKVAHKAGSAHGGFVRVVYRYEDNSIRTVLIDPKTRESTLESTGTARVDANDNPLPCWWPPL